MRGESIEVNEAVEDVEELPEEVGRGVLYANWCLAYSQMQASRLADPCRFCT